MSRADLDPLPADFFETWSSWFPDAPPVGFLLREAEPDRWLRIHSLPGSRRYPTSGWDHAELLRRHNAVATDLLGEGAGCAAVLFDVCDPQRSSALGARAGLTESELPSVGSLPPELWDEDEGLFVEPVCLFGGSTVWRAGAFDTFIAAVADDRVRGLFAALKTGAVYAPYDGGADLFSRRPGSAIWRASATRAGFPLARTGFRAGVFWRQPNVRCSCRSDRHQVVHLVRSVYRQDRGARLSGAPQLNLGR